MKFLKIAVIAAVSMSAQAFAGACFYEHADFQGASFCVRDGGQVSSIQHAYRMNDMISSISVDRGTVVEVYEHDNYGGDRMTIDRSTRAVPRGWNDKISSVVVDSDRGGWGRGGRDDDGRGGRDDDGRGGWGRGGRDDDGRGGWGRGHHDRRRW